MKFLEELEKAQKELQSLIKEDDLIWIHSAYRRKPHCYEVTKTNDDGITVTDGDYIYSWIDVLAVFRFDGLNYRCIWRKKNEA